MANARQTKHRDLASVLKQAGVETVELESGLPRIDAAVYLMLASRASVDVAKRSLTAITADFVDWNEVRVSSVREIGLSLKMKDGPARQARASEIREFLVGLFEARSCVSLEFLDDLDFEKACDALMSFGGLDVGMAVQLAVSTQRAEDVPTAAMLRRVAKKLAAVEAARKRKEAAAKKKAEAKARAEAKAAERAAAKEAAKQRERERAEKKKALAKKNALAAKEREKAQRARERERAKAAAAKKKAQAKKKAAKERERAQAAKKKSAKKKAAGSVKRATSTKKKAAKTAARSSSTSRAAKKKKKTTRTGTAKKAAKKAPAKKAAAKKTKTSTRAKAKKKTTTSRKKR